MLYIFWLVKFVSKFFFLLSVSNRLNVFISKLKVIGWLFVVIIIGIKGISGLCVFVRFVVGKKKFENNKMKIDIINSL